MNIITKENINSINLPTAVVAVAKNMLSLKDEAITITKKISSSYRKEDGNMATIFTLETKTYCDYVSV